MDLAQYLPPIDRTSDTVAQAEANLTLPKEQLKYAQFWFIKVTPLDDIAFNHLYAGDMSGALDIWAKKDNASSLQNRLVCGLINEDCPMAMACAERLYSVYVRQFVSVVMGDDNQNSLDTLAFDFMDTLCEELGADAVLPVVDDKNWQDYIRKKSVEPLIESLQSAVDAAKSSRGKGSTARYDAGVRLMNGTKASLSRLKTLLPAEDLQYQVVADKLGLEILQCGIDYFNGSDEPDAAHKAMQLQSYAMNVVVGKMAKDRCKENVDILQKIIAALPPAEVFAEDKAIKEALREYRQLPDKICHAVTLLDETKPHLQSIKAKLGSGNAYYLKISTQVVENALYNIIEEVNAVQQDDVHEPRVPFLYFQVKAALEAAWKATKIMDTFDMESEFKINRYNRNRTILRDLCGKMGIYMRENETVSRSSQSSTYRSTTSNGTSTISSSSNNSSSDNGIVFEMLVILIVYIIIIGILLFAYA